MSANELEQTLRNRIQELDDMLRRIRQDLIRGETRGSLIGLIDLVLNPQPSAGLGGEIRNCFECYGRGGHAIPGCIHYREICKTCNGTGKLVLP
jgi:hypothetical protein